MPTEDDVARLRLVRTEGVGPMTWRRLLGRYHSPQAALAAIPGLVRAGGRSAPPAIPSEDAARREFDSVARLGGRLIFLGDPDYPPPLAHLDDAPPMISVLGDAALLSRPAIAIVGGRNASAAGLKLAERLAEDLAVHLTVVSGLARGIDGVAHTAALRTGRTVAAIAGGLDVHYPAENANLQRLIGARGALITEAPLGAEPQARHFPRRNRLIAGLSLGVLVVEAARRSGSLITARIARDLGREVFAVPGSPLDPRAHGGNDLIREGAILTASARDVLDNLAGFGALFRSGGGIAESPPEATIFAPSDPPDDIDRARAEVAARLSPTPIHVDDLTRRCQLSAAAVMAALLELELAGRVETLPGNRFALLTEAGS
jgi:DNA processing protein